MEALDRLSDEEVAILMVNYIQQRGITSSVMNQLAVDQRIVIQVADENPLIIHNSTHIPVEFLLQDFDYCVVCGKTEFEESMRPCIYPTCQDFVCSSCHVCFAHSMEE